jgi:Domain of unknown function (DUF6458)
MGIGTALALIAIGAILAFATHFHVSGIDVQMIGWILIFMGIAMLVITLAYTRPRRRRQVVEDVDVVDGHPQPGAFVRADTEVPPVEPAEPPVEEHVRRTVHRRDLP